MYIVYIYLYITMHKFDKCILQVNIKQIYDYIARFLLIMLPS